MADAGPAHHYVLRPRSQSGSAYWVQIETAGECGYFDLVRKVIEDVEGENTESRLVAFAPTGEERTPADRTLPGPGAGGAEAGDVRVPSPPTGPRETLLASRPGGCRKTLPEGGGTRLAEPRFPHTRFLSQGKPAIRAPFGEPVMRTPLRELKLQPKALTDSGKGPPMFSSLTPSLRKLELKVRFAGAASKLGYLPRLSAQGNKRPGLERN